MRCAILPLAKSRIEPFAWALRSTEMSTRFSSRFPGGKRRVQPKGFLSSGPGAGRDVYALRVLTVGRATRSGTTGMPCLTGSKSVRLDCSAGELGFLNQPAIAPEASIDDRSDRPAPGQVLQGERETSA